MTINRQDQMGLQTKISLETENDCLVTTTGAPVKEVATSTIPLISPTQFQLEPLGKTDKSWVFVYWESSCTLKRKPKQGKASNWLIATRQPLVTCLYLCVFAKVLEVLKLLVGTKIRRIAHCLLLGQADQTKEGVGSSSSWTGFINRPSLSAQQVPSSTRQVSSFKIALASEAGSIFHPVGQAYLLVTLATLPFDVLMLIHLLTKSESLVPQFEQTLGLT